MTGEFLANGVWVSRRVAQSQGTGLILDRDGVLVEERGYLQRPADVKLETGAVDLLRWARKRGLAIAVATNQSGLARGLFGWDKYFAVEHEIDCQLAKFDLSLDMVVACPFHPDFTPSFGPDQARWRKPGPAMLELIVQELNLDVGQTWMIGDKESDVASAKAARIRGAILTMTGYGAESRHRAMLHADRNLQVLLANDLREIPPLLDRT